MSLVPFPERLKKSKEDGKFRKFLDICKALHINVPYVNVVEQMPRHMKFMKAI